jgi:orotidine-5'-phosphate decarboxylase
VSEAARDRLVLALDVGGLDTAETLARRLAPWFAVVKVGFELYAEAGPAAFERFHALGLRVFADLKLYDIPTTVERAARVYGRRGVEFLNFPAVGGEAMLRAGVEGFRVGARESGHPDPVSLAVTVLTSEASTDVFGERLDAAIAAGCAGVVCAGEEIGVVKGRCPSMGTMVPGIRLAGGVQHDQARVATPAGAVASGADWLVIGRAVTGASDPEAAADAVTREVTAALAR